MSDHMQQRPNAAPDTVDRPLTSSPPSGFGFEHVQPGPSVHALLDAAPDAIVIVDKEAKIAIVNRQTERLFGYTRDEMLGHEVELLIPEHMRAVHRQHRARYMRDPQTRPMGAGLDLVARRKDGSEFPVEISLSPLQTDAGLYVTSVIRDVTERRRMEQALRESERRFRAIFDQTFQFMGLLSPNGTLLLANQTALDFAGCTHADVVGRPFWETYWWTIAPDTQQRLRAAIAEAAAGAFVRYEVDVCGANGRVITIDFSLKPISDDQGQVMLLIPEGRDITARKQAEQALRQSEERFAKAFRGSPAAISISTQVDGRFLDVNESFLTLTGYQRDEVIGKTSFDLDLWVDATSRTRLLAALARQESVTGVELKLRTKAGGVRDILASVDLIDLAGQRCLLAMTQDITERKQAQLELERQVQRRTAHLNALLEFSRELLRARSLDAVLQHALRHAFALVPEANRGVIYLADQAGQQLALRASAGFSQVPLLRVPATLGIVGMAFTQRRTQVTNSVAELEALVPELSDPQLRSRLLLSTLDGTTLPSGVVCIPLLAYEQVIGVLLLLREHGEGAFAAEAQPTLEGLANLAAAAIVEERMTSAAATLTSQLASLEEQQRRMVERLDSAEAGMLQAARLAAVGQLAASVAHEINNPLYAIRNGLYLLEEDLPAEIGASPYWRMVNEQLARIANIIERMRDFYRPVHGELAPCDLNHLLEETLALAGLNLRHGAIDLVFTPAYDLPLVVGNGDQLRQVFLNLMLNAIDAMPEGGTLTVRTEAGPAIAVVVVQDTGIGIPEDVRAHLFEPFFTTKPNGTGLGLSISAHIITQHGGRIEVESAVGRGSTFQVVLPYQSPTAPSAQE